MGVGGCGCGCGWVWVWVWVGVGVGVWVWVDVGVGVGVWVWVWVCVGVGVWVCLNPYFTWFVPFSGNGFANSVLSIAPVRAMCGSTNAGLSTLRTNPLASATTAAHALGHMFGLDHDGGLFQRLTMHRCLLAVCVDHC